VARRVEHEVRLQQALRAVLPLPAAAARRPLGDHLLHRLAEVLVRVRRPLHHREPAVRGGGRRRAPRQLEAVPAALGRAAPRGGLGRAARARHGGARPGVLARAVVEVGRVGGEAPRREEVPRVLVVLVVGGRAADEPARRVRRQPARRAASPLLPPRHGRQVRHERRGRRALAALPLAGLAVWRRGPPLRLPVRGVEWREREEGRVGRVDGAPPRAVDGDVDQRRGARHGEGQPAVDDPTPGLLAAADARVGRECHRRRLRFVLVLVLAALPAAAPRAAGEHREDRREAVLQLLAPGAGVRAGALHRLTKVHVLPLGSSRAFALAFVYRVRLSLCGERAGAGVAVGLSPSCGANAASRAALTPRAAS
jgi:hypothetical protein